MAVKYLATGRLQGTTAERTAMTTGWLSVGTKWTPTTTITYEGNTDTDNHGVSYDIYSALGDSVASNTWVLRFEHTVTSTIGTTNGDVNIFCGLSDSDMNTTHQQNQDWIGVRLLLSAYSGSDYGLIRPHSTTNSAPQSGQASNNYGYMGNGTENTKFYIEIIRTSSSAYTISISNGDNYDGDVLSATGGSTSATGLRYIKFGNQANTSSRPWDGLIENIKFQDDVTSFTSADITPVNVYPNLSNGTIFEDTTDGKHYMWDGVNTWNEMA